MLDFPASLGRRPVTFAQLKRHTNVFRKLKPCCMLICFSFRNHSIMLRDFSGCKFTIF